MRFAKKIFILSSMFLLFVISEVFGVEGYTQTENRVSEDNYNELDIDIDYDDTNLAVPKFVRRDFSYANRLSLGSGLDAEKISQYDLRDDIDITVRDQGDRGFCWIYTTNSVIETNVEKMNLNLSTEFDEEKTYAGVKQVYNMNISGNTNSDGGNQIILSNYYISGKGPINDNEKIEIEIENYTIFPSIYKKIINGEIQYQNSSDDIYEPYEPEEVKEMRNLIKEHIIKYGAVSVPIYADNENCQDYFNETQEAYYCDDVTKKVDHVVTIIGWDDTYSKENFNSEHRPLNNGAYIALNSWGEGFADEGVFYISYDDMNVETFLYGIKSVRKN